jgi:hypothetical protein
MYQIAFIPFQNLEFLSLFNQQTQEIFISPKTICEIFGISWGSQRLKIIENSLRWNYQTVLIELPRDSQKRKLGIIPEKKVRSWICSINPEKVKPEIREQLIAFQDECDEVLHHYWTKGIAINPRLASPPMENIVKRLEQLEENQQKLSLQVNSLVQEFLKMNERITVSESKVDSLMDVRKSFDERHWLFGKFVEIIANEIDFNRNEVKKTQQMLQNNRLENPQNENVVSKVKALFEQEESSSPRDPFPILSTENHFVSSSPKIDKKQAEQFRDLVKEKGKTQKGIFEIWSQFKQKFQLQSYHDLPASHFQQALLWLNKR